MDDLQVELQDGRITGPYGTEFIVQPEEQMVLLTGGLPDTRLLVPLEDMRRFAYALVMHELGPRVEEIERFIEQAKEEE